MNAWSRSASCKRTLDIVAPPWKTGQFTDGPKENERPASVHQFLSRLLCQFTEPVSEKDGKSCATATPIWAVAAWSWASDWRISGRRRSSSDGRPAGIFGGTLGRAPAGDNLSSKAAGGCANSTLKA